MRHEILEGAEAVAFADGDGDVLAINIDARVDERGKPPVRHVLAVSLEVPTTSRSDIHEEVRQGLVQIRERQQQIRT